MPLGNVTSFTTTDFASTTDDTYYYVLRSSNGAITADSAPVAVIHDRVSPMSPIINWPYGSTYAPTSNSIPIDCTGSFKAIDPGFISSGDPTNTGSGISHYLIYRRVNNGSGWSPSYEFRGNVTASFMESNVFYDNDPGLTNEYQYAYMIRAFDRASNWVDSPIINFTFNSGNRYPGAHLDIQYLQASATEVGIGEVFTVSVQVANVGIAAGSLDTVSLRIIHGGISVLSQYGIGSLAPALPISLSPGTATIVLFPVQPRGNAWPGQVLISANCTWNGGNPTTFDGPPAAVIISSPEMVAGFQHVPEIAFINQTINFTDTSYTLGQNITSWEWNFSDGSPAVLTPSSSHTYGTAGQFNVSLSIVICYNFHLTHSDIVIVLNQTADDDIDGLTNGWELLNGLDPFINDTDADGLLDGLEILTHHTNATCNDTDADGLLDGLEILLYHTNATCIDTDADGLLDGLEIFTYHSNATCNDTDVDGLLDGLEVYTYHTNPCSNDTDADGLFDADELFVYLTNVTCDDTDADGLLDGLEVLTYHSDATCNDTDADGLLDGLEIFTYYSNVTCTDTDGDGLLDGTEVYTHHTNPCSNDTDADGLFDADELFVYLTNVTCGDTDADGLLDGLEILIYHTNATCNDTDADGLLDGLEILLYHTNATCIDTDTDGLLDGAEVYTHHTNPYLNDTDADSLLDGLEVTVIGSNPLYADTDHDGLSDGDEHLVYHTNPLAADTDADGMPDKWELDFNLDPLVNDAGSDVDMDELVNVQEYIAGADPLNPDTDGDGMPDGWEYAHGLAVCIDDSQNDPDRDGLTNINEFRRGCDPKDPDTDGDAFFDGTEELWNTNPLDPNSTPLSYLLIVLVAITVLAAAGVVTISRKAIKKGDRLYAILQSLVARLETMLSSSNVIGAFPVAKELDDCFGQVSALPSIVSLQSRFRSLNPVITRHFDVLLMKARTDAIEMAQAISLKVNAGNIVGAMKLVAMIKDLLVVVHWLGGSVVDIEGRLKPDLDWVRWARENKLDQLAKELEEIKADQGLDRTARLIRISKLQRDAAKAGIVDNTKAGTAKDEKKV
nr:PKD domain-containing protein [Candidatus Sigynarchaeota archaeon]